jgi:hypothetical protein
MTALETRSRIVLACGAQFFLHCLSAVNHLMRGAKPTAFTLLAGKKNIFATSGRAAPEHPILRTARDPRRRESCCNRAPESEAAPAQ